MSFGVRGIIPELGSSGTQLILRICLVAGFLPQAPLSVFDLALSWLQRRSKAAQCARDDVHCALANVDRDLFVDDGLAKRFELRSGARQLLLLLQPVLSHDWCG